MADVAKRVKQFIEIRDKLAAMKKEYEEKIAPYQESKDKLAMLLLKELNASKAESMRTIYGTFYRTEKQSCSIVDKEAFWDFVVANEAWDLIDKRANAQAVADWANTHKDNKGVGIFPPGLNYSAYNDVGVRRN